MKTIRLVDFIIVLALIPLVQNCDESDIICEGSYTEIYQFNSQSSVMIKGSLKGERIDGNSFVFYFEDEIGYICGSSVMSVSYFIRFKRNVGADISTSYVQVDGVKFENGSGVQYGGKSKALYGAELPIIDKPSPATVKIRICFPGISEMESVQEAIDLLALYIESVQINIEYKHV
jgi:hypothetical protein